MYRYVFYTDLLKERLEKMKKILIIATLILTLTMLLASLPTLANSEKPSYGIESQTVGKGESFSMVVSISNNPGIISLRFEVEYDTSALRLDSVEDLGLLPGYFPPSPNAASPYMLRWSVSTAANSDSSGELVRLNFTAVSEEETVTSVKINHVEANRSTGTATSESIVFENAEASIEIKERYTVTFVDEDGVTVISEAKYFADETVVLPETPAKPSDAENKYAFSAWAPEFVETVSESVTYTATYEATPLSDDATLSAITVEGSPIADFDPSVREYSVTVDHTVQILNVVCTPTNEFASVSVEGTELRTGDNTIIVTVTSEKGSIEIYTLLVTRLENPYYAEDKDSTLKEMTPSSGVLTPAFDPARTSYILYVENASTEIFFICVANSEKAKSVSTGDPFTLSGDVTEVQLFCVAESGDKTLYTVKIVKLPAFSDGKIPSFVYPSDEDKTEPPATDNTGGEVNSGNTAPIVPKISTTTVIIIIALAALFAVAAIIGIVLLVVSNKKAAKSYKS